jgi:hypothetical protein
MLPQQAAPNDTKVLMPPLFSNLGPAGVVLKESLHEECCELEVGVAQLKALQVEYAHDLLPAGRQRRDGVVENVGAEALAL